MVREKHKMVFKVVSDKSYNNPATGVMADQMIMFGLFIIVVLIEIPIIKFCVKYLPYVFAQKDLL